MNNNEREYIKEINEKYSYEKMFSKPLNDTEKKEELENLPIVYENKNIFDKIIDFIKNIFRRERKK